LSLAGLSEEALLCARCRIPLALGSETEKRANGETVIYRYYVCPACNSKILDEKISIKRTGETIEVRIEVNGGLQSHARRRRVQGKATSKLYGGP